jgi:5-hydroxyisourate hydrolase-like protein (transthyretin family)
MTIFAKVAPMFVLSAISTLAQAVEGHVVNSATGDGIADIEVRIHQGAIVVSTLSTDASGRFTVHDLTDGDYTATYATREYSPSITDSRPPFLMKKEGNEQPFHVSAGADGVKLEARMMPYGRIAGRVIDGWGEPVASARLLLTGSRGLLLINADGHGDFDIHESLRPGAYKLSAAPVGHLKPPDPDADTGQPQRWARTYYPGVESEELASEIILHSGVDVTGIEIKLAAVPVHSIRGTITYPDDTPAAKITIRLGEGLPGLLAQSTQSREDGTFQFKDVTDGLHEITAVATAGDINLRVSQLVEVAGQDLDRVNIALAAPFTVTGKVILETPEGRPTPAPPGAVSLGEVSRRPHDAMFRRSHWANPDAKGDFNITSLYPGTYIVSAGAPANPLEAPAGYFLDSIRAGDVELPDRVVRLTEPLPITLIYKTNGGTVRGTVEHCASGVVWLFPRDATLHARNFAISAACHASDQYEIDAVRPGEYYAVALSAANPSPFSDGILEETLIALATSVTVRAGEMALADLHLIARPLF